VTSRWTRALAIAGTVGIAACGRPQPATTEAAPTFPPPAETTATPFLPRGFDNLPTRPVVPINPSGSTITLPTVDSPAFDPSTGLDRLNLVRADEGVSGLAENEALAEMARQKARALAHVRALSHDPEGGRIVQAQAVMGAAGFGGRVAEVVLAVRADVPDPLGAALQAVLTDPANRAVVLDPGFTLAGLGLADADGMVYVVMLLAEVGPTQ
jgi:uncharacterized protein YkwD